MTLSARSIYLRFALAWLIVAGALVGGVASAQATAGLETWSICAPSGANGADDHERAAHAGGACCTTLCGYGALDMPVAGAPEAPALVAFAAQAPRAAGVDPAPAGIGPQAPRAPPA